jgi:uncharacterized membrane protein HdeD (DUF308 family)
MPILAATHHNGSLVWGVILIVVGVLHLVFRRFYARRSQAIHDARQDTAPGFTKAIYRRHSASFYLIGEWILGIAFIVIGLVLVITNA